MTDEDVVWVDGRPYPAECPPAPDACPPLQMTNPWTGE
jgi:hypothetical protein